MENIKYLIPQQSDFEWGIVTTTVGMQDVQAGCKYPYGEHPHDYLFSPEQGRIIQEYQILYILQGRGWFESTHCSRTLVQGGDVILLFPGEWHSYAPDPEVGWTEAWIGFTGGYADHLVHHQFFSPATPHIRVGAHNAFWTHFEDAYEVAKNQTPAYQQQLAGYVCLFLSKIYALTRQPRSLSNSTLDQINQAKHYMAEHSREVLLMEQVAREVGMGYSKFRKDFKTYTGFTPGNYFIRLKLAQSKDLLLSSTLSCKEIAFEMGFDTVAYFHQLFHRFYGLTPNQFRKQAVQSSPSTPKETRRKP
ncbi:MAG: AraC family transcriptional regulator [Bacteroidaceae bacterium]|nr:AraC family transcriptional regulator [Bacteroidaceae bacterium]